MPKTRETSAEMQQRGAEGQSDARAVLDAAISEEVFMQQIIQYADMKGWNCYHTRNSRGSHKGFPDLCLLRFRSDGSGRLVYLECKSMKGRPTVEQRLWIMGLSQVPGVIAMIVKPCDWEAIERVLA